jgi:uncharacterized lipoprotein YajG
VWKTFSDRFRKKSTRSIPGFRTGALLLGLVLLVMTAGCVTRQTPTRIETPGLPRPGAKVTLIEVGNATGQTFEVDVESLLRESMKEELIKQGISANGSSTASCLRLSLEITEYRPGSAFKRWVVPGYGATVLGVRGELLEPVSGTRIASVTHQRTISAGGLYTIGAWQYIFGWVARDIAKDLKVRIEKGGEFVVSATPRAEVVRAAVGPIENVKTICVKALDDRRTEVGRIGERKAAFGVDMGDVHFSRDVASFMKEALETELSAAGHRIVTESGDLAVTGELQSFWVRTETTPLYWDVIADAKIQLAIARGGERVQRGYAATAKKRTYVWPSASLLGQVVDQCVDDLMSKIRADTVWRDESTP